MKIFMDVDEVLISSIKADLVILNERYGTNFTPDQVKTWNFRDCFPQLKDDEIEEIFNDEKFFKCVELKNGAKDFINAHYGCDCDITFITKGNEENLRLKAEWLENKGLGNMRYIGLPLNESKGKVDMSDAILIDDNQDNLNESNAKIKILYENYKNCEWNSDWKGLRVRDFNDLNFLIVHYIKD